MSSDNQALEEFTASRSTEGKVLINRCIKYIEEQSENKNTDPLELRGMIRLMKYIKYVEYSKS